MGITLIFLGRLADSAGCNEKVFPAPNSLNVIFSELPEQLVQVLRADKIKTALNGSVVILDDQHKLHEGDELAFLPPVSGG